VNDPFVVHDVFEDGEAVLINLETGNYYSLNPVGAEIWSAIRDGAGPEDAAAALAARYDGDPARIATSVAAFFRDLLGEGLIAAADAGHPEPAAPAQSGARRAFEEPVLERFNDMRELLLLDPIHDVEESGWPNRRADGAD
jgi:hypothetical protein